GRVVRRPQAPRARLRREARLPRPRHGLGARQLRAEHAARGARRVPRRRLPLDRGRLCRLARSARTPAGAPAPPVRPKEVTVDLEAVVDLRPAGEPDSYASPRDVSPAEWRRFEQHVGEIFAAFGMDLDTPGTRETPARFLRALYDATAGYDGDEKLLTAFPSEAPDLSPALAGMIVEGPISFVCLCEHHALPFYGAAHVGYVAGEQIIGISKLTRLVRLFARRFTVQERLGEQI